jgi:cephalosporin hydroxylase
MNKKIYSNLIRFSLICLFVLGNDIYAGIDPKTELGKMYNQAQNQTSDINEHVPVLYNLAKECSSVVEIGVRHMVSTWGLLQGLSESSAPNRSYLGIDLALPPADLFAKAVRLSRTNEILFDFWQENDLNIIIPYTDLLFIDSFHTYCHLTYELETFSPYVSKYIAMHDTSAPWGNVDEPYHGDYSEYPDSYNRDKRGLWPAVEDFLKSHPEWVLHKRLLNNHGFTILKRVE